MFGREMKNMLVCRIAEERAALLAVPQIRWDEWYLTPLSHDAADVQTPVGIQIVHHPVIAAAFSPGHS